MSKTKTALIIVDVQYDFLPPNGALAVPGGLEILPIIEDLLDPIWGWECIVASQDYHPPGHISFASSHPPHKPFSELKLTNARNKRYSQNLWPDHCVQGTRGCEIENKLMKKLEGWGEKMSIVRKGTHPGIDAYSAFEGHLVHPGSGSTSDDTSPEYSELTQYLRSKNVDKVVIVGLATDYCVCQTALSALSASFLTVLLAPAMRAISSEGREKAFDKIGNLGGSIIGHVDDGNEGYWKEQLAKFIKGV